MRTLAPAVGSLLPDAASVVSQTPPSSRRTRHFPYPSCVADASVPSISRPSAASSSLPPKNGRRGQRKAEQRALGPAHFLGAQHDDVAGGHGLVERRGGAIVAGQPRARVGDCPALAQRPHLFGDGLRSVGDTRLGRGRSHHRCELGKHCSTPEFAGISRRRIGRERPAATVTKMLRRFQETGGEPLCALRNFVSAAKHIRQCEVRELD